MNVQCDVVQTKGMIIFRKNWQIEAVVSQLTLIIIEHTRQIVVRYNSVTKLFTASYESLRNGEGNSSDSENWNNFNVLYLMIALNEVTHYDRQNFMPNTI